MCKEWRLFFITLVYELLLLLVPIFYNQTVLTVYDYQYLFTINQYQQYVIITYCFKINVFIFNTENSMLLFVSYKRFD